MDELRVMIFEEERTTAYFTFLLSNEASLQEFRIYGRRTVSVLDQNHEIVLRLRGNKFKSYADNFVPPVLFAGQHLENLFQNVKLFLHRDFQMDSE